jgi:hypothetical protein
VSLKPGAQSAGKPPGAAGPLSALSDIDWQRPWLSPWRAEAPAIQARLDAGQSVAELLNALNEAALPPRAPVRFVPQSALPEGQAYEQFIFANRQVPTRENLHDLFNGLCWLRFPETKRRLNELQGAQIASAGVRPLRGALRDALTVFDENAALLLAPQPLWDALLARQWQRLFVELRPLWRQARLQLFGHALLEKLVHPRKAITAHVYLGPPAGLSMELLDRWVAGDLHAAKLAAKPFVPLPVLGVPGWWADNEEASFYDDPGVFRLPRPGP